MALSPDAPLTWPNTLPLRPMYGFTEQRQRNLITFAPDVGAPKMRRRSTAAFVMAAAVFQMTDTQLVDFNVFFEIVTVDGTLPFTWAHPRTGIVYSWCFAPDEAPSIQAVNYQFNTVSCKLLRLT